MEKKRIFALYVKSERIKIYDYPIAVRYWRDAIQAMKQCKRPCYIVEIDVNGDIIRDLKDGQPVILKHKNWGKEYE